VNDVIERNAVLQQQGTEDRCIIGLYLHGRAGFPDVEENFSELAAMPRASGAVLVAIELKANDNGSAAIW
jgi:hypothetical protein